jgi:hypothetical protein
LNALPNGGCNAKAFRKAWFSMTPKKDPGQIALAEVGCVDM